MGQIARRWDNLILTAHDIGIHRPLDGFPPKKMVVEEYDYLDLILHNVGGGEAQQIVVHHTSSEFRGDLSHTMKILGLLPGQKRQDSLSVRPLASGPVPLVIAIDYSDQVGNLYQITYSTRIDVLKPGQAPTPPPAPPPMTATRFPVITGVS